MNRPGDKAKDRPLDEWLGDMPRDAATNLRNTADVTKDEFLENEVLQHHVIRRLTNIDEASKSSDSSSQSSGTGLPRSHGASFARTRDVLNHAYFGTSPQLLWQMASADIPPIHRDLGLIKNRRSNRAHGQESGKDKSG